MNTPPTPKKPGKENTALRLALDLGPLILFFAVNGFFGIFTATAVFMLAILAALAASRLLTGKFATMPLVTGVFVLFFGGLTLYLQDETFIKIKPTMIYLLFAAILLGGLAAKRMFLKNVMGEMFSLHDAGWRELTLRWAGFFVVLALLNEAIWRNVSTDVWVSFKVFGLLPLTIAFAVLQAGLLQRHAKSRD